jgi:putative flavoprotein involved in K+ transport
MAIEKTEVVVVGAGQAGLAMSAHLGKTGIPHIVLERNRIAERWRAERWDSLVANGPAWHDCYPGLEFPGYGPDEFVPKEKIADAFVAFAERSKAPVRCGVEVKSVRKNENRLGFRVETSQGIIEADYVVAATGPFQKPVIPGMVPETAGLMQIHSTAYRNPRQLPACRLPMSCGSREGGSTFQSAHTIVRRAAIAAATSSGGWAFWASGMRRRRPRAASM